MKVNIAKSLHQLVSEFRRGDEADIVLERADKALYHSKNNGRNQCTADKKGL